MQFSCNNFLCDIEVYVKDNDYVFRLYDGKKEPKGHEMHNLVIVDSGYGFICVKVVDIDTWVISGYLNSHYFTAENMVDELLAKIEEYLPNLKNSCSYHHIELVDFNKYIEYNGEY